jgi:hypothetical protein
MKTFEIKRSKQTRRGMIYLVRNNRTNKWVICGSVSDNCSKRNYHRLNYDPWAWKPIAPETAEEKADRKRREAIAAKKRAKRKK